jgi:hypothetical protein
MSGNNKYFSSIMGESDVGGGQGAILGEIPKALDNDQISGWN